MSGKEQLRGERRRWHVRVMKGNKVRGDDPIKYFLPMGVRTTHFLPTGVPEGVMAIEVLQNEEISGGRRNRGGKESALLSVEKERIGGA